MSQAVVPAAARGLPRWARWAAVAAWMGVIFYMSAQSDSGAQSGALTQWLVGLVGWHPAPEAFEAWHHALRKLGHFSEYAVLAGLLWAALESRARRAWWSWGLATAYAATDELHQVFVANRGPALTDVAIDSSGALLAVIGLWLWRRGR